MMPSLRSCAYFKPVASGAVVSALVALLLCLLGANNTDAPPVQDQGCALLIGGRVPPAIYIPRAAAEAERLAAEDMARVLREMGMPGVEVRLEPWFTGGPGIYVGDTEMARWRLPDVVAPTELSSKRRAVPLFENQPPLAREPLPPERWDTIGLSVRDGAVVLAGSDAPASRLAVYWFLQEYGGVRWWAPGPLGESIPRREQWRVPQGDLRVRPSFVSRVFSGLKTADERQWSARNLLRAHTQHSHNIDRILPERMAAEHPDWFPLIDRARVDPVRNPFVKAHPDLSNRAVAAFVAEAAIEAFDESPGRAFFSIGLGDHLGFGDLDQYPGLVDPARGFRGMVDFSPLVFTFANRVARQVAAVHPDRFLGCLSYFAWEDAPPFPVEPSIMPVLTADRSQWYDPAFRAGDLATVERWAAKGTRLLATWDYIYGKPFFVPRVLLAAMQQSIPALHARGVNVYYAELYPVWGFDAPKAWIAARLTWDATADPQALEAEFFEGFYGPAAAPMREFFHRCDAAWMRQPPPAQWIKFYQNPHQTFLFPPAEVEELRALVQRARAAAADPVYQQRIDWTLEALDGTAALVASEAASRAVSQWTPIDDPDALLSLIPQCIAARASLHAVQERLAATDTPNQRPPMPYALDDNPLPGRLALLRNQLDYEDRRALFTLLPESSEEARAVAYPAHLMLEDPFARGLKDWQIVSWPSIGTRFGVNSPGQVEFEQTRMVRMHRMIRVDPGSRQLVTLPFSGKISPASHIRLTLRFIADNGSVAASHSDLAPYGEVERGYLCATGAAPEGVRWAQVFIDVWRQEPGDRLVLGAIQGSP